MTEGEPIPDIFRQAFLEPKAEIRLTYANDTIEETNRYITDYFGGGNSDPQQFFRYIDDNTYPFLLHAQKGLIIEGTPEADVQNVNSLTRIATMKTEIIMGSMPDLPIAAPSRTYLPTDLLRRSFMQRPIGPLERIRRVVEMMRQLESIKEGSTARDTEFLDNPQLIRTVGFFQAGTILSQYWL